MYLWDSLVVYTINCEILTSSKTGVIEVIWAVQMYVIILYSARVIWQDFDILLLGTLNVLLWECMWLDTTASTFQLFFYWYSLISCCSVVLLFWCGNGCDWTLFVCSQVACNTVVEQHISTLENKLITCHLKQKMSLALCTHTLQKQTGCLKNNTKMSSGTNISTQLDMER